MKPNYLIVAIALLVGFGGGVAFHRWGIASFNRYQLISGGSAGNAFRQDTQTGDTWLITSTGLETLVIPPDAQVSLASAKQLYDALKDAGILDAKSQPPGTIAPQTLRDWAIQMNRISAKEGRASSGIYDPAALRSPK